MNAKEQLSKIRKAIAAHRWQLARIKSDEQFEMDRVRHHLAELIKQRNILLYRISNDPEGPTGFSVAELADLAADAWPLAEHLVDVGIAFLGAHSGDVRIFDGRAGGLIILAQRNLRPEVLAGFRLVRPSDGTPCARALRYGTLVAVANVEADGDFAAFREAARDAGIASALSAVLRGLDGNVFGVASVHFQEARNFSLTDLGRMDQFAQHAGPVLERHLPVGLLAGQAG